MSSAAKRAHPVLWVPTLYFAMGVPNAVVGVVAAIMYKNLGLSNAEIALYTGSMYLPWVIKPFWAPLLELFRTKRFFVLAMEITMALTLACVALALKLPAYLPLTITFFWATAFASATQDIAGDGVYITSLTAKEQALLAGVQGAFWNLARVLVTGALVSFTKSLFIWAGGTGDPALAAGQPAWFAAWTIVMLLAAGILGVSSLWHLYVLPPGAKAAAAPSSVGEAARTTFDSLVTFFQKRDIWLMIAAVFFYRFGEGFIEKIGPLFLLDRREIGGLGLDNAQLGYINGIGTVGFIGATVVGGLAAARYSLRRTFVPLAWALNIPHVTYFFLSQTLPTDFWWITAVVTVEKIGYGLGTVGMMLYMMQQLAPGPYKTSHYAFATGIMAANMMLTGMVSGRIQEYLGYQNFFVFVLFASIPPIVLAWLAPFHVKVEETSPEAGAADGA